jgi:hypothetical protein
VVSGPVTDNVPCTSDSMLLFSLSHCLTPETQKYLGGSVDSISRSNVFALPCKLAKQAASAV